VCGESKQVSIKTLRVRANANVVHEDHGMRIMAVFHACLVVEEQPRTELAKPFVPVVRTISKLLTLGCLHALLVNLVNTQIHHWDSKDVSDVRRVNTLLSLDPIRLLTATSVQTTAFVMDHRLCWHRRDTGLAMMPMEF